MTLQQARRILDRQREGNDISNFDVCEALRVTGDISRWIAKDSQDGVSVRYSSSTDAPD